MGRLKQAFSTNQLIVTFTTGTDNTNRRTGSKLQVKPRVVSEDDRPSETIFEQITLTGWNTHVQTVCWLGSLNSNLEGIRREEE